ncbi:MAG: GNAT family N-acetyltransferase [Gammaproteobacteria bacterium]|nr:GNAT family N-acetyltransferase [Gammaproteobacteria bacterium]
MEIRLDDPARAEIAALLSEHLDEMFAITPPQSVHALDVDELCRPGVSFWAAWDGRELLGCGALSQLSDHHGEIKSMRTVRAHLRKGVASNLLEHMIAESKRRSYSRLSLETGSMAEFEPARNFYRKYGFEYCKPFGDYAADPNSVFMTLVLD